MQDRDCVQFLQWALPQLGLRWEGFRKVRAQVCKRIDRRLGQLTLPDTRTYQTYLHEHPPEWSVLEELCRITISRFYRDKLLFSFLATRVLPALAQQTLTRRDEQLRAWSAGCASGEEAYTLNLIWRLQLQALFPNLHVSIIATDLGADMINRARHACYPYSSIKNLPHPWQEQAFICRDDTYCLKSEYRRSVEFVQQDIREAMPAGKFDVILCRNLAFTYFDTPLQCRVFETIRQKLLSGGVLVIGIHETLPASAQELTVWSDRLKIFRVEHPNS